MANPYATWGTQNAPGASTGSSGNPYADWGGQASAWLASKPQPTIPGNAPSPTPVAAPHSNGLANFFFHNPIEHAIGSAVKAVGRPVVDLATFQGGKAVHDTSQLTSDVSGGTVNQFARSLRYTPQMLAADVTNNPRAQASTQLKAFGTNSSGRIAGKIAGSTIGTGAMLLPGLGKGTEALGARIAPGLTAKIGASAASKGLTGAVTRATLGGAKLAPLGAAFNAGSAIQAGRSPMQVAKAAGQGALFTGALGAGGSLLGSAISRAQAAKDAGTPLPASAIDNHVAQAEMAAKQAEKTTSSTTPAEKGNVAQSTTSLPSSKSPADISTPVTKAGETAGKGRGASVGVDVAPGETHTLVQGSSTPYTSEIDKTLRSTRVAGTPLPGKESANLISKLFSPGGGAEGKAISTDLRASLGSQAIGKHIETLGATPDIKMFGKMNSGDHLSFIQKVDTGTKQDTPALQAQADKMRVAQNQDYELARSLKPNTAYVENYFPRAGFWDNSANQVKAALRKWGDPSLGGSPAALEHRAFPTIYDGIKMGLTPKETNPAVIALNSRVQLMRAKMAQDFMDSQEAKGRNPDLVKEYVDRVMSRGMQDNPIYKDFKQAGYALNNIQLGFSGFHVAGTALNSIVSKFSNGVQNLLHGDVLSGAKNITTSPFAPAEYIFKGNKIIKDYKAGNITPDIKNIAEGGGRIGGQADYRSSGLAKSLEQFKSGNVKEITKGTLAAPFRAFSTAAKPIMEWWVPRIKAGATQDLINRRMAELGPNASADAVRAAKAAAVDSIDNRFGQLVQDNLMWNKTVKDGMSVMMRSPGWNIGTVRELGGGATDIGKTAKGLVTGKGLNVTDRTSYTASLAATTMMIGTAMSYMFTGKPPQSMIDYFYPKTGQTNKAGDPERVALPSYAKDVFAFSHSPTQTVTNKLTPGFSIGKNLLQNKDYFGNQVRNPQDSAGTQLKQVGGFVAKNALPFTVTNSNQRAQKSASTKAQSFFGITPAPGYITKSTFEQKVASALHTATGSKPLTPEQSALVNAKGVAKQAATAGDTSKIKALYTSGQITLKQAQNLKAASQQTSVAGQFKYLSSLDRGAAAKALSTATPADLQKLGDLKKLQLSAAKAYYSRKNTTQTRTDAKTLYEAIKAINNR